MPLKGFVDEARKTNKKMEIEIEKRKNLNNIEDNIIDISDGQKLSQEKLQEIKNNNSNKNTTNGFNYIKKNNQSSQNTSNNFEINQPQKNITPKTEFEKQYLAKQQSTQITKKEVFSTNGTGIGKNSPNNSKQKIESKHGNIIANVIRQSANPHGQKVPWKDCKYLKKDSENYYCTEFHCICKKDACPFSCK